MEQRSIIKPCDFCGISHKVQNHRLKSGRGKYCSVSCKSQAQKGKNLGSANCMCKECGTTFHVKPYAKKRGRGIFCSKKCQGLTHSKTMRGANHPMYGKHHTEEANYRNALAHMRRGHKQTDITKRKLREINLLTWSKPETIAHWLERTRVLPTKPERMLMQIIIKHSLPFEYTGNSPKPIGHKVPDFTHLEKPKVIEVFGDYWHKKETNPKLEGHRTEVGCKNAYANYGYDCFVLWESDLMRKTEEEIVGQIEKFCSEN